MEFELLDDPPRLNLPGESWLALKRKIAPEKFPGVQLHFMRVEKLYPDSNGSPAIEIELAYIDASRVVRATRSDEPHSIYLRSGIWGEIIYMKNKDLDYNPTEYTSKSWQQESVINFCQQLSP